MCRILAVILSLFVFLLSGCNTEKHPLMDEKSKKELLVYCGITLVKPVREILDIIEKQENCAIKMTYGGSGELKKSIGINQMGDIFIPGEKSYIEDLIKDKVILENSPVGYNVAALFVQKGNPKHITNDLNNLADPNFFVVIGSKEFGSIGKETFNILSTAGIYDNVVNNATYVTTDSKDLLKSIKEKEADIVINWRALAYEPENINFIDVIEIDPVYAPKKPLIMGILKYSKHRDIALKILEYSKSEKGKAIFKKYGFGD